MDMCNGAPTADAQVVGVAGLNQLTGEEKALQAEGKKHEAKTTHCVGGKKQDYKLSSCQNVYRMSHYVDRNGLKSLVSWTQIIAGFLTLC